MIRVSPVLLAIVDVWLTKSNCFIVKYILNKGSIVGPIFKEPLMGPFLQSVNPKFEEYYAKWLSGPLSCVSVFHKYCILLGLSLKEFQWLTNQLRFVVIASTRDMARKVFNSPAYVKPCVVDVAHKLLGSDNWVFLDGKAHIDYRKGLNGLFTRKALQSYLPGQEEVYNDYFERFLKITTVCITPERYLSPKPLN